VAWTVADRLACLAVAAPGIAPLVERELRALGIRPDVVGTEGVSFRASQAQLYEANLWLRTATRVVVRVATFPAETFAELERRARRVAWGHYIAAGTPVRLRVTCRKSRLYHSDAVAERVAGAIRRAGGVPIVGLQAALVGSRAAAESAGDSADDASGADPDTRSPPDAESGQLVVVRLFRDQCTVSVDSSGALLHRRGYRQEIGKAPLRETLAAAVLMTSGWDCRGPLLDPLCGSGTVVIEGALLARRRAPGCSRNFAFMRWPAFEASVWRTLVADARSQECVVAPAAIQGSDRDAGATAATVHNAMRAGVADDIDVVTCAISAIEPPPGPGWLVTNPPYGVRVGDRDGLRNLYAQLGRVARAKCAGWTVGMVSGDRALTRQTRLPLTAQLRTTNGGLPVELVRAELSRR
jgi:putative N6-adenine-specific DNA methylase